MSSKRNRRRRSCDSKKRYEERQDAVYDAGQLRKYHDGGKWTAYRCRFCGCWHVGRSPAKEVKAMWARRAQDAI